MSEVVVKQGEEKVTVKTQIVIPPEYMPLVEDLRLLTVDGQNPNKMNKGQQQAVWSSLQRFGWVYPIITNEDGVFADGEQRQNVCLAHNEFYVPVLRLPIKEVDRRLLRQVLNKLKGKHERELDREEFQRIIEAGGEDDLKALLALSDEKFNNVLREAAEVPYTEAWEVIVECENEVHQQTVFEKLSGEGYKCRVLTL